MYICLLRDGRDWCVEVSLGHVYTEGSKGQLCTEVTYSCQFLGEEVGYFY